MTKDPDDDGEFREEAHHGYRCTEFYSEERGRIAAVWEENADGSRGRLIVDLGGASTMEDAKICAERLALWEKHREA